MPDAQWANWYIHAKMFNIFWHTGSVHVVFYMRHSTIQNMNYKVFPAMLFMIISSPFPNFPSPPSMKTPQPGFICIALNLLHGKEQSAAIMFCS